MFASSGVQAALSCTLFDAGSIITGSPSAVLSTPSRIGSSCSTTVRFFRLRVTLVTLRITCTSMVALRTVFPSCFRAAVIVARPLATGVSVPLSDTVTARALSLEKVISPSAYFPSWRSSRVISSSSNMRMLFSVNTKVSAASAGTAASRHSTAASATIRSFLFISSTSVLL